MTTDSKNSNNPDVLASFKQFEHFCKTMLDGWVVVDAVGNVVKCNQMFSSLTGVKSKIILKSGSLDDIITFKLAGNDLRIIDLLRSPAPKRFDEVVGNARAFPQNPLNVIIGTYPFIENGIIYGAFILVRDVTAETSLQDKYKDKATQSITDSLTGLFNRNYFTDYLESQMRTYESFPDTAPQKHMSVIMMDIDFFKKINDLSGHQAGDHVLKVISDLMKKCFRKTDVVARYGGEEFLAILPGTDVQGAAIASDKFRQAVETTHFMHEGKRIPVTISIGVAQIAIGSETSEQAIARADSGLYHAKHNGRNQVCIHNGKEVVTLKTVTAAA